MHVLLGLMIVLAGAGRSNAAPAPTEFRPNLLSYAEVMQLNPTKRTAYFRDVAELLAVMEEKFDGRYDVAMREDATRLKGQVALLMRMAGPDEASAATFAAPATEGIDASVIVPRWDTDHYTCGDEEVATFDVGVATCVAMAPKVYGLLSKEWKEACPAGTKRLDVQHLMGLANTAKCVPQASYDALPEGTKKYLGKGKFFSESKYEKMTPAEKQALTGVPATDEPKSPSAATDPNAEAPVPACATKPRVCEKLTRAKRDELTRTFRNNPEAKVCVAGGFFTEKHQARQSASCELVRTFPKNASGGKSFSCTKGNEVLCNPTAFCLQLEDVKYVTKGQPAQTNIPAHICVKNGPRITRACNDRFTAYTSGKQKMPLDGLPPGFTDAKTKTPKACDPSTLNIPFKEEYQTLAKETRRMYETHCQDEKLGMIPLFCEECKIVGERLRMVLAKAGKACGGADEGAAPAAQPPAASGTPEGESRSAH